MRERSYLLPKITAILFGIAGSIYLLRSCSRLLYLMMLGGFPEMLSVMIAGSILLLGLLTLILLVLWYIL